jgi:hypothetical protein
MPLGQAIAVFAVTAYLLMVFGVLLLPETRGRELAEVDGSISGLTV